MKPFCKGRVLKAEASCFYPSGDYKDVTDIFVLESVVLR